MESEARAVAKLSRAATGFGYSRRHHSTRSAPVSELVDGLLEHLVYGEATGEGELSAVVAEAETLLAGKDVRAANLVSGVFLEKLLLLTSYPDNLLARDWAESLLGPHCRVAWHDLERLWMTVGHDIEGRPNNPTLDEYLRLSSTQMRREFRSHYLVMANGELVGGADILAWEAGYRYTPAATYPDQSVAKAEGVA